MKYNLLFLVISLILIVSATDGTDHSADSKAASTTATASTAAASSTASSSTAASASDTSLAAAGGDASKTSISK